MKKLLCLIMSLTVIIFNIPAAYGVSPIKESPKVRIVIEGSQMTFSNTPVTVNERVMLPLREILTKLGVQNDNEHILWNEPEQSVTVFKGQTKIYLKVGQSKAYINDQEIKLDAAPINYNSRVFIPVRFVSQSLGKKVVWDDPTSTIFIRDENEFNRTKEVLDKISAANESVKKYKFGMDAQISLASKEVQLKGEGEADFQNKILYMNMGTYFLGNETRTETYLANNSVFSKKSSEGSWQKKGLHPEQFEKMLNNQIMVKGRVESMAAGLVLQQEDGFGDLRLKGDFFMDDLLNQAAASVQIFGIEFNRMNIEITVDRNTYLQKSAVISVESNVKSSSGNQKLTQRIGCTYSDYNGSFEVKLPEGIHP